MSTRVDMYVLTYIKDPLYANITCVVVCLFGTYVDNDVESHLL